MYEIYTKGKNGGPRKRTIEELLNDEVFDMLSNTYGDSSTRLSLDGYIFEESIWEICEPYQDADNYSKIRNELEAYLDMLQQKKMKLELQMDKKNAEIEALENYASEKNYKLEQCRKTFEEKMRKSEELDIVKKLEVKRNRIYFDLKFVIRSLEESYRDYKIYCSYASIQALEKSGIFKDMPGLKDYLFKQPLGEEVIIRRIKVSEDEYKKLEERREALENELDAAEKVLNMAKAKYIELRAANYSKVAEAEKELDDAINNVKEAKSSAYKLESAIYEVKSDIDDVITDLRLGRETYSAVSSIEKELRYNGSLKGKLV